MDFIRLFDSFAFKMKAFIKLSLYSWEGGGVKASHGFSCYQTDSDSPSETCKCEHALT